jgi:glycosyltransferase involved in cell wall biosynthesis
VAISAIAELPTVNLLVVGDGPERAHLEELAHTVAQGRVMFLGSIDDVRTAYVVSDAVVLPSRGGDSMPATLIEAGLTGLPSVATPVEGIPDIVVDGETGWLVPSGSVTATRDAIARIALDPTRGIEMGRAARAHCSEHFGIEPVAARWSDVLREAVA